MTIGTYNIDGVTREYWSNGKAAFDTMTDHQIERVWAYPVRQAVVGGESETLYFSSKELREEYMRGHDYCDALPRRKVPEL